MNRNKSKTDNRNRVKVYPVPDGAVLQEDYCLRVRPAGTGEWQELQAYRVRVDMHDVRNASMAYFDFSGRVEVEITFPRFYTVYRVDIRPLSFHIKPEIEPKKVTFTLDRPVNLSVEINKDRFHNLHLFAGDLDEALAEMPDKNDADVMLVKGSLTRPGFLSDETSRQLEEMPGGRTLYVEAGIYYIGEAVWRLPSHTSIYLEGGTVLIGGLAFERGEGLRIYGKGIDMMSCRDVTLEQCFLRTSDDCVAVYGSRWDNFGDSRNIAVRDMVLWADVAHPLMIGTHGDHAHDGDIIEHITFENIDILEHHEFQAGYLGAMAINAGDKNLVRDVVYRNIRIEPFEHGKVLDFQVKWNKDYNPAPGRGIEHILLEDIDILTGDGEEPSVIAGYSGEFMVRDVVIRRMYRDGKTVCSLAQANIQAGAFAEGIWLGNCKKMEEEYGQSELDCRYR